MDMEMDITSSTSISISISISITIAISISISTWIMLAWFPASLNISQPGSCLEVREVRGEVR